MRNFNTRFRLRDSDRHIRLVYTFFLLLMLAGFTFSFFWAHSMTGLSPQGIANHYRGSDATFGEPIPGSDWRFLGATALSCCGPRKMKR